MRKIYTNKFLAATSLALTVAAFGCTTNRYPGNGEPTTATPGYGAANQSVTPGSSSGTGGNPPMASGYIGVSQPNTDAIADAAAARGYQGRVLGAVNPEGVQLAVPVQPTGGAVVPPAMLVNPQSTINASVSSPNGDQGITGGVGGGGGGVVLAGAATVSGGAVSTGSSSGSTAAASPIAVTGALGVGAAPANGTVVTAANATSPSISGNATFAPQVMKGTVNNKTTGAATTSSSTLAVTNSINVGATPASGTVVPSATATSPSISGSSIFAPAISNGVVTGTTAVSIPTTAKATTTATTAKATTTSSSARSIGIRSGLVVQQNSSGQIVVSNVSSSVPSTKASTTVPSTKP